IVQHALAESQLVLVHRLLSRQANFVALEEDEDAHATCLLLFQGGEELQFGVGNLGPFPDAAAVVVSEDADIDAATAHPVLADGGGWAIVGSEELHVADGQAGAQGAVPGCLDESASTGHARHQAGMAEEDLGDTHGDRASAIVPAEVTVAFILPARVRENTS